ncbi:MAG: SDR family oxidoreductase [Spirochaetes bacterium]|nr:SDR family oxidoreductase [Spirochaetota bacterium]
MAKYDFKESVVLITGGAQGLGFALADAFLGQNARVAILDVKEEALDRAIQKLGPKAKSFFCDVSRYEEVEQTVARIEEEMGGIEVLVNNAGIVSTEHVLETKPSDWERMIGINLTGAFYCLKEVARQMVKRGIKGRIINISSLSGRSGGIMVSPAYSASKAGLLGLTKAAARQLASFGITVNAVAPGSLDSEMLRSFGEEKVETLRKGVPLGRLGSFQDVVAAVLFLASKEAEFIDGVCLDVNGGQYMAP